MEEQDLIKRKDINDDESLNLVKTNNISLNDSWIYDCIFSSLSQFNSYSQNNSFKNQSIITDINQLQQQNHDHNDQQENTILDQNNNSNLSNNTNNKETILACSRKGNLFQFNRYSDGSFSKIKCIYSSTQQEEFYRLFEDCDSIDYNQRYLFMSGSKCRVHIFKPKYIQENDNHNIDDQNKDIIYNKVDDFIPQQNRNAFGICKFRKHSHKVLTTGQKNTSLYDVQHKKIIRCINYDFDTSSVEYNRDLNVFSVCGINKNIIVYDDRQYKHIFNLSQHNANVLKVIELQNNNQFFLASGSHDMSVILWDIRYQKNNQQFNYHHNNAVFGLAYNPFKKILYSSSWDKSVKALNINNFKIVGNIKDAHQKEIINCKFSKYNNQLITCSRDESIQFYSTL